MKTDNIYLQKAKEIAPWLEEIFKHLHQHPELSKQEYETQKFILAELEKMGIEAAPGCCYRFGVGSEKTGSVTVHNPAFMVDLDALPIGTAVYAQIAEDFLNEN